MNRVILLARSIALLALVLAGMNSRVAAADNTTAGGDKYTRFVGHYGEVLDLRSGAMRIEPEMHGPIEVINYYPDFRIDLPDSEPFRAKPSDWEPENFTRLGLIQLVIMPHSASSTPFNDLKRAKIAALQSSGVEYRVIEDPMGPILGNWPEGTFEIRVTKPYLLSQLYTATSSYLCILTSGVDVPPSTMIGRHSRSMRSALAEWIVPLAPRREAMRRRIDSRRVLWRYPRLGLAWVCFTATLSLFAGLLGAAGRWKTLRHLSLSILVFSNSGALAGGLVGLMLLPFPWPGRHVTTAAAVTGLLLPIFAWLAARHRETLLRRRIMIGTTAWALVAVAAFAYFARFDSGDDSSLVPIISVILSFVNFGIGGAVFSLLDSFKRSHKTTASLLLLLLLPASGWSQSTNIDRLAIQRLEAKNITEKSFEKEAIERLSRTQVIYDHQRVEMKGIWSKSSDTNARWSGLFDLQLEPTHTGLTDDTISVPPVWFRDALAHLKDLHKLRQDTYNHISDSALDAVAQLKEKDVNEIVAHSWGTEIIYNAILAGEIRPPRRLIVAGMPDRDMEKWRALSRHTGTEVIVYTNSHDPAAGAARFLGGVGDNLGAVVSPEGALAIMSANKERFERQWDDACLKLKARGESCNPHQRHAPETVYRDDYLKASHDRFDYYQGMMDRGDLPHGSRERDQPEPGSAWALQDAQNAKVIKEARRLYVAEVNRERRVLEAEAINGDASFIAGLQNVQTMSQEAKRAFEAQARADERAAEQSRLAAIRAARDARKEDSRRAQEQFDRENRAKKYVQSLAGEACSNPDRMHELAEDHGIIPVTDLLPPTVYNTYDGTETSGPGSLSRCQREVLDLFDAARSRRVRVMSTDLAQWAKRYREANPGLGTKIGKTVSGFFSSFGDLLEVPVESSNDSSPTRERPERTERRSREEDRCTYTYFPELNQTIRGCLVY